jgi:uncharacterized protein (TIGR03435 family)
VKASGFGLRASGTGLRVFGHSGTWLHAFGPALASAIAAVVMAPVAPGAQAAFDVASIKESTSLETGGSLRLLPDGGVQARNIAVRGLITIAYQLKGYQLVNAPGWASEVRYNVEARPAAPATRAQTFEMLQALLVERFRLSFRRESRELDGFAMLRVHPDRLGPDLKPSELNCEKEMATIAKCRQGGITTDTMTSFGAPMWNLLQVVVSMVGAPVNDETGLTATYDMSLRWTNEVAPSDDRPSIYTALQEQLGLKLERRRVTTEVLVVDRLERATPN